MLFLGHTNDTGDHLVVQSSLERMQRFLMVLHESCYHMMGSMGLALGRDLYNIPDLALAIINSVLTCLQVSTFCIYIEYNDNVTIH